MEINDYRLLNNIEETFNDMEMVRKAPLRYKNGEIYKKVFLTLLSMEAQYNIDKITQTNPIVSVNWKIKSGEKATALIKLPNLNYGIKIKKGDPIRLSILSSKEWSEIGYVEKVPENSNEEWAMEFNLNQETPIDVKENFVLEFIWKSNAHRRMESAVKCFGEDYVISPKIRNIILGHEKPGLHSEYSKTISQDEFNVPNLPALNNYQILAIKMALTKNLSLIQGPPGTGKSSCSASIIYCLTRENNGRILVCAPSNAALDNLAEKIAQTGIKIVRLCSKANKKVSDKIKNMALHNQIENLNYHQEFQRLRDIKEGGGELTVMEEYNYKMIKEQNEMEVLENAQVICCTCIGAGDTRLKSLMFHTVLIDEAVQSTEPESMVPIVLGAERIILVGDQSQLGPVVMCKKAAEGGLSQSLFERLLQLGVKPLRLKIQYRMHPELCQFPSNFFYEGTLQSAVHPEDRQLHFPWPQPEKPMFFYVCKGHEEKPESGMSYLNRAEAALVEQLATSLLEHNIHPNQIGIITPYEGQRSYLIQYMKRKGSMKAKLYQDIEIANVNAFQGREKDFILMSCVRSNENQGIGFLNDPRRLNVALTRARYGVIIVGNPEVLCNVKPKEQLWCYLLEYFKNSGVLVEGPINNLQQSLVRFRKPIKLDYADSPVRGSAMTRLTEAVTVGSGYHRSLERGGAPEADEDADIPDEMLFYRSQFSSPCSTRLAELSSYVEETEQIRSQDSSHQP